MTAKPENETNGVIRVRAKMQCLDGDELWVCLLQANLPELDLIKADSKRPSVVAALRALLATDDNTGAPAKLDELVPGGRCSLLVVPEYALGSDDWLEVDELVRQRQSPLVLIAGFGATSGSWFEDWACDGKEGEGPTIRLRGWTPQHPPSDQWRYNAGWCWVHDASGNTHCVTFLKNFPEQKVELNAIQNLDTGRYIVRIEFDDLDLFPLICADLIHDDDSGDNPIARIRESLSSSGGQKYCLIAASLFQNNPQHEAWQNSISRSLEALGSQNGILVLGNHAVDVIGPCEEKDKWRALSGVFASGQRHMDRAQMLHVRRLSDRAFTGVVVRRSDSCLVAGPVRWSESAGTGRYLWRGAVGMKLAEGGDLLPIEGSDPTSYEVTRLIRRHDASAIAGSTDALDQIVSYLEKSERPARVVDSVAHGVEAEVTAAAGTNHPDDPLEAERRLVMGLLGLGFVFATKAYKWSDRDHEVAFLIATDEGSSFLIWNDSVRSSGQIDRALQNWTLQPGVHSPLLVVAAGYRGLVTEGNVVERRRSDISTSPPAESGRDISSARARRTVRCAALGRFENAYEGDGADTVHQAVQRFIADEMSELRSGT